jgi:hypothetical protein
LFVNCSGIQGTTFSGHPFRDASRSSGISHSTKCSTLQLITAPLFSERSSKF